MFIKKGDTVKILAGKDRGETGKVAATLKKSGKVIVEGRNQVTRHERPKKQGQKGQKIRISMPLDLSNLMLVCPHCGKPTRVGHATTEKGGKVRMCKQCKKHI